MLPYAYCDFVSNLLFATEWKNHVYNGQQKKLKVYGFKFSTHLRTSHPEVYKEFKVGDDKRKNKNLTETETK